jgi:hypothetical protein
MSSIRASRVDILRSGLQFMQDNHGDKSKTLDSQKFLKYNEMIAKKNLSPAKMPPTTASATEHVLGAYLQYHNWVTLDTSSWDPLNYG